MDIKMYVLAKLGNSKKISKVCQFYEFKRGGKETTMARVGN